MNKIDTLLFSGGGIKCISLLGSLKSLITQKILNEGFKGISTIYYVSGSSIFTFPILIGLSIDATIEIFKNIDYSKMNIMNSLSLDSLFSNYGFQSVEEYYFIIEIILKKKGLSIDLTLEELYKINKINIYFKVINVTKNKIEYINHKKSPHLTLKKVISMTSCIPILFNPVEHNGSLYVDGGLISSFPYEKFKKKTMLGLNVITNNIHDCNSGKDNSFGDFGGYLEYILNLYGQNVIDLKDKYHIKILIEKSSSGFDFDAYKNELELLVKTGYDITHKYINTVEHSHSNHHSMKD